MQYDWTLILCTDLEFLCPLSCKSFQIMGCSFKLLTDYKFLNERVRKAVTQAIELAANPKFFYIKALSWSCSLSQISKLT